VILQSALISLYLLLILATLIIHDIYYTQLHDEYQAWKLVESDSGGGSDVQLADTEHRLAQEVLLIAELAILGLFLIDFAIHAISYGLLFLKHVSPILEALLILANMVVLILMAIE
jgi:hypothetical protein